MQAELPPPLSLALFVGSWLPWSETFIYDQVRRQQRFHAHVFARERSRQAAHFPYPDVTTLGPLARAGYFVRGHAPAFEAAFTRARPRLVHAHFGPNGALALPLARSHGVPLAVSFHGHDVPALLPDQPPTLRYARYRRRAAALFEHASLLLCASAELADLLVRHAEAPAAKIVVHRLGVDLDGFAAVERDPAPFRVLMIGRLVPKKGMAYGIEAFGRVLAQRPEARLVIVGDGPLRTELTALCARMGIAHAIDFRGGLPHAAVREELLRASVLLAPSVVAPDGDRESGMIVVKEAGAARLPVVASRHGGIPEILEDGVTGYLCAERDVDALGARLLALADAPALREELGAAARAKIEREYDGARQHAELERLLLRCVLGP
jgi:colanic acid/amylovoran biosynthesis glycosyltransferase